MYKNKFAVSIKSGGKLLKEDKDGNVYLPFKSNYSVFLKNLNSRKALVKISIDGEDIGNDIIISPKRSLDLERFLGDLNSGSKFLFTEKTQKISDYRGDRIDDGILCVEIFFEKEVIEIPVITYKKYYYDYWEPHYPTYPMVTWQYSGTNTCDNNSKTITYQSLRSVGESFDTVNCCANVDSFNSDGITVKGSISNQQFSLGNISTLESQSTIFIFQLKGIKSSGVEIKEPVTKKSKIICEVCGTENSVVNFCGECGNYLN